MKCPYCGNTSGKTDSRGGCISCGGSLENNFSYPKPDRNQPYRPITGTYASGGMITGSSYLFGERGMETMNFPMKSYYMGLDLSIFTPNEIRKQLGLPELSERELFEDRYRFGY